jgi:hypothetical protein
MTWSIETASRLFRMSGIGCAMSLPLEVVLRVIEHARHDSETLRSCCLLCVGCVAVSQRLLFDCARVSLPTVDRVLELQLLLEQKIALAAYITDLHVDAGVAHALHALRGRLPNLRTITAQDCHPRSMISWTTMEPEALATFALSCPSLQDLRLDGIQLERALFNADPHAIEVHVRNLATAQTRAQLSPLRGLTKELAFPRLHTAYLTLCSVLDSDEAAIQKLLRDCPSMRVLRVDLPESCPSNGAKLSTIPSLWSAHGPSSEPGDPCESDQTRLDLNRQRGHRRGADWHLQKLELCIPQGGVASRHTIVRPALRIFVSSVPRLPVQVELGRQGVHPALSCCLALDGRGALFRKPLRGT